MTFRPSRRVIAVGASLVLLLAYGAVTYAAVDRARAARRAPRFTQVTALMPGDWPHHIVARYVLLRPGTPVFSEAILPWILRNDNGLSDMAWNRYLVEQFIERSGVDFTDFVKGYPLTPSSAFVQRLASAMREGERTVVAILARSAEGRELMRRHIDERLGAAPGAAGFVELLPIAVAVGPDAVRELTARLTPPAPLLADAVNGVDVTVLSPDQWMTLYTLVASAVADKRVRIEAIGDQFAAMLNEPVTSNAAAKLLLEHLSLLQEEPRVVVGAVACEINDPFSPCEVMTAVEVALRDRLLAALFERFRTNPQEGANLFHIVAHTSPMIAADLAAQACQETDSIVRKSVVVLAIRHEVPVTCRDTAFTGEAPRLVLFHTYEQYVTNSQAAAEYEQLAGHAFFGVGKRWPVHYGVEPAEHDAERWQQFISAYPWFPAVDDAYLRLAYAHLLAGRHGDAVTAVARYRTLTLLDDDSTPFIDLLEAVARSESGEPIDAGRISTLRQALREDAWFWTEESLAIDDAAEAVDWFIRNEVGVGPRAELLVMRREVEAARAACVESQDECRVPDSVRRLPASVAVPDHLRASYAAVFGEVR